MHRRRAGPVTSRRVFLCTLTGGLFAASRIAEAQRAEKVYRIGYLGPSSASAVSRFTEAFRQGLRELGWVEGQNIVIEYRFAEGQFNQLPNLAAELARLKVDVIVVADSDWSAQLLIGLQRPASNDRCRYLPVDASIFIWMPPRHLQVDAFCSIPGIHR